MEENIIRRVLFDDLKNFCCQVYMKVGVPAIEEEIVADLLVRSSLHF